MEERRRISISSNVIGIESISLNYGNVNKNSQVIPTLTILPENYSKPKSIQYAVTAGDIYANVDTVSGIVTGIKGGSATITVTIVDGNGDIFTTTGDVTIVTPSQIIYNGGTGLIYGSISYNATEYGISSGIIKIWTSESTGTNPTFTISGIDFTPYDYLSLTVYSGSSGVNGSCRTSFGGYTSLSNDSTSSIDISNFSGTGTFTVTGTGFMANVLGGTSSCRTKNAAVMNGNGISISKIWLH